MTEEKIEGIVKLIEKSALDQTIKDILIRDLKTSGLSDFLKEQIKAYCLEGLKKLDDQEEEAKGLLEEQPHKNPA